MRTVGERLAAVAAAFSLLSVFLLSAVGAPPVAAGAQSWGHRDARVCGQAGAGQAQCTAIARAFYQGGVEYRARTQSDLAAAAAAAQATYYTGTSIRTAYGITAQGDPSKVIAIVDAYDDPNAFANVTTFRSGWGLPPMATQPCALATLTGLTSSSGSPCFTKVNETGGTSLPSANSGWSNEIDLDLQAASSVCPMCSILLLEANSASTTDLETAVTTASNTANVLAISNSYGISGDYPGSLAPAYDTAATKGIAVTASAGDGGYGVLFPASSTNVIGVGGTTLTVGATGVRTSETVWSGTGSGCSVYNTAPKWQSIPGIPGNPGNPANPCAGMKAVADLSADADPNSGLAIYTTYDTVTGYWIFGGTSLSSPLIAALYAMQGGYSASFLAGQYAWTASTPHFDVTSGSNGTCSPSVLCTAGVGWDGPTGLGSIAVAASSPVLTTITVTPTTASVQTGGTQQFTATGKDQYGQPISANYTWSVNGGGSISTVGLFTAGSTAGTFTVTASSGGVNGTASVTVTGLSADFSLSVSPTPQSVSRGGTATYTVTIKPVNGFSGSVTLSLSGQPSGSTVTFTPTAATTTSTLRIKTRSTTLRQTYSLTIKGVSGSLSHTTSASLTVTR